MTREGTSPSPINLLQTNSPTWGEVMAPENDKVDKEFKPFVSNGFVSLIGEDRRTPVSILRDTGAKQSLIREGVLPFSAQSCCGADVLAWGVRMCVIRVPLHLVQLSSQFLSGEVKLGVRPQLPVAGIDIILGNDLAGGTVFPSPEVVDIPLTDNSGFDRATSKAVQTVSVKIFRQRRGASGSQQQQQQNRRQPKGTRRTNIQTTRVAEATMQSDPSRFTFQDSQQQNAETRPPARKRQGPRRHRDRRRGQLMVANAPSPTLKFDTDFDFDSSNAQFIKEALEKKLQEGLNLKDGNSEGREKEGLQLSSGEDHFGPKCYYDKAKFFFDNISSDNGLRLTWAGERKRNLETFGVPGRFLRGQGFRGGRQCFGGGCSARAGG
ncbi:protein LSM14 homolog B-like isoform X1 [Astatotilapia calliptera]|uniref:protein LSM14 homolog B-like isoform X1 n=1 Tax=Astatotilapia calliptera TaxID=8154 RepID=UPI000E4048F0|nr:protein LSM14 homolog B-like isoform X1 [Astatotilapia calliptera]